MKSRVGCLNNSDDPAEEQASRAMLVVEAYVRSNVMRGSSVEHHRRMYIGKSGWELDSYNKGPRMVEFITHLLSRPMLMGLSTDSEPTRIDIAKWLLSLRLQPVAGVLMKSTSGSGGVMD